MTERNTMRLAKKLATLRAGRDRSLNAAAIEAGIWKHSLQRLEAGKANPEKTPIKTVLSLVLYYWPKLQLADFVTERRLKVIQARRLQKKEQSKYVTRDQSE